MKLYHSAWEPFYDLGTYIQNRNLTSDFGQKLYMFLDEDAAFAYANRTGRPWMLVWSFDDDLCDLFEKASNHYHLSTYDFGGIDFIFNDPESQLSWVSTVLYNRERKINSIGYQDADVMFGPIADAVTNTLTHSFVNNEDINDKKSLYKLFKDMKVGVYGDQLAFSEHAANSFFADIDESNWESV